MTKPIDNYFGEIEPLIAKISSNSIKPGLERIAKLLRKLGNPERRFKAVHVLGTNGKGSTACFIDSILRESGMRIALYSSPHIRHFGERLVIDGNPLPPAMWVKKVQETAKILEKIDEKPSFFEVSTAIAFTLIAEAKVNFAIIEAGLGGRLDATNVMPNVLVSVFTDIAMDHQEYLGNDILSIATEKFSALRPNGKSCYIGGNSSVEDLYVANCKRLNNEGHITTREWKTSLRKMDLLETTFDIDTQEKTLENLKINLKGSHQVRNAANALMAIHLLETQKAVEISENTIRAGLLNARWPGRFEVIKMHGKTIILDGAHNPHGMASLVSTVKSIFPNMKFSILFAAMKDKEYEESLKILNEIDGDLFLVSVPEMDRSETPQQLAKVANEIGWKGRCVPEEDLAVAFESALNCNDVTLCCGSLYLIDRLYKLII